MNHTEKLAIYYWGLELSYNQNNALTMKITLLKGLSQIFKDHFEKLKDFSRISTFLSIFKDFSRTFQGPREPCSSMWPVFDSICDFLLVLYSALRGFSPSTPVSPSPQKPTFQLIRFDFMILFVLQPPPKGKKIERLSSFLHFTSSSSRHRMNTKTSASWNTHLWGLLRSKRLGGCVNSGSRI